MPRAAESSGSGTRSDYRANPQVQTLLGTVGLVLGGLIMLGSAVVWLIKRDGLLPSEGTPPDDLTHHA